MPAARRLAEAIFGMFCSRILLSPLNSGRQRGVKMNRLSSILFCLSIALSGLLVTPAARADGGSAQAAFERLKSLAGRWQGTLPDDPNSKTEVNYRVTAGGSALVETEFAGQPHEMVTVYHLDGEKLIMTHYCAAGNQPTLRFDPERSSNSELFFDFASGTNMDPAKDLHIHSGKLRWTGENTLDAEWVTYKDGRSDHTMKVSLKRLSN